MPEFDTYHAIERYAKNPHDVSALYGFTCLRRLTESRVTWNALGRAGADALELMRKLYTFSLSETTEKPKSTMDKLLDMSEEQRQDWFKEACASVGVDIDPTAFVKEPNKGA